MNIAGLVWLFILLLSVYVYDWQFLGFMNNIVCIDSMYVLKSKIIFNRGDCAPYIDLF